MSTHQHIIYFSLNCLPGIHKFNYFSVASNRILTWFLFCNSEFLSCCFLLCLLKKKKKSAFIFVCLWCISRFHSHHGWNNDSSKKWTVALFHTFNLGKMRYSYIAIFMLRIIFSLWQIWNNYSLYSLFLLSTWRWIFFKN